MSDPLDDSAAAARTKFETRSAMPSRKATSLRSYWELSPLGAFFSTYERVARTLATHRSAGVPPLRVRRAVARGTVTAPWYGDDVVDMLGAR
ncbi:MAG: hypothetical protein DWQ31_07245 [Planctomycetota bacterium]|nr:MAG: hypothetical protein DWQ31_07245 [Planctomycetota bacterium]REJ92204.1 MAG: hypothetical protein DWQ35_12605 [Planctomycetota bacterium]REK25495.1 MAG: hypothetical protein DWQ42_11355 [Planctomycetota bacterium]